MVHLNLMKRILSFLDFPYKQRVGCELNNIDSWKIVPIFGKGRQWMKMDVVVGVANWTIH